MPMLPAAADPGGSAGVCLRIEAEVEVHDVGWAGDPFRGRAMSSVGVRFLEAVLHEQVEVVTLVEHLAV